MLRQLLTLLAVFTGLTAAVEPARALDAGVETVQLAHDFANCHEQVAHLGQISVERRQRTEESTENCVRPVLPIYAPTVMLKADRARE